MDSMSQLGNRKASVFISYARSDIEYVKRLATFLEDSGLDPWFDVSTTTGVSWPLELRRQLDRSAAMIVVMSLAAGSSEWVQREINHAQKQGKTIMPLLLDGEPLFQLNTTQYEDVTLGNLPTDDYVSLLRSAILDNGDDPLGRLCDQVTAFYQMLGYSVEPRRRYGRFDVDLTADRERPEVTNRIFVFCSASSGTLASTSKSAVASFINKSRYFLDRGECTSTALVVDNRFTDSALSHFQSEANGILSNGRARLLTLRDLRHNPIGSLLAINREVSRYEVSEIARRYVDLEVKLESPAPALPTVHYASDLLRLAESIGRMPVVLTADFGSGKTTILDHINYRALNAYLADSDNRLPCKFKLKLLLDYASLDAYVQESTEKGTGTRLTLADLIAHANDGKLILLLDGFDEISSTATSSDRAGFVTKLAPILFTNSPTIVSSRPSYFESLVELRELFSKQRRRELPRDRDEQRRLSDLLGPHGENIVETLVLSRASNEAPRFVEPDVVPAWIQPISSESVDEYLSKFEESWREAGFDTSTVKDFLATTYDLTDLVTRPLLLDMIVEMIRSGMLNPLDRSVEFGPARIYQIYTEAKLRYDAVKRVHDRAALDMNTRRRFAEEAAWEMHTARRFDLSSEIVRAVARRIAPTGGAGAEQQIEGRITDLRTCFLLTSTESGNLEFVHRSFQEYFAAFYLYGRLMSGELEVFRAGLPREVLYFLGSIARLVPACLVALQGAMRRVSTRSTRSKDLDERLSNLISAVFYAGESVSNLSFPERIFTAPIYGWPVSIAGSRLGELRIPRVERSSMLLVDSEIKLLQVNSGQMSSLICDDSVCRSLSLDCELAEARFLDSALRMSIDRSARSAEGIPLEVRGSVLSLEGGGSLLDLAARSRSYIELSDCRLGSGSLDDSYLSCVRAVTGSLQASSSGLLIPGDSGDELDLDFEDCLLLVGWSWTERNQGKKRSLVRASRFLLKGSLKRCLIVASPYYDLSGLRHLRLVESEILWGRVQFPDSGANSERRRSFLSDLEWLAAQKTLAFAVGSERTHSQLRREMSRFGSLPDLIDLEDHERRDSLPASGAEIGPLEAFEKLRDSTGISDVLALASASECSLPGSRRILRATTELLLETSSRRRRVSAEMR